jgi:hypothetical protein
MAMQKRMEVWRGKACWIGHRPLLRGALASRSRSPKNMSPMTTLTIAPWGGRGGVVADTASDCRYACRLGRCHEMATTQSVSANSIELRVKSHVGHVAPSHQARRSPPIGGSALGLCPRCRSAKRHAVAQLPRCPSGSDSGLAIDQQDNMHPDESKPRLAR